VTTITMQQVAEHAKVSKATVSRVLNNDPSVADDLRLRVLKAMQDLGYQPNRAARRLRGTSSGVIGLVITDIQNPFFISVMQGVEDTAYANQTSILFCNTSEDLARQQMYLDVMQAERAAGLILVPTSNTSAKSLTGLKLSRTPLVLLDRWIAGLEADIVQVDNVGGAQLAVRHFIDLGHDRIALVVGAPNLSTGRERQRGYRDCLMAAGLPIDESLIKTGNPYKEDGYRLTRDLMLSAQPPRAIVVGNSMMTLGALQALRELGVRIPDDVAIVGFDDLPWADELCPPLTAVSQPTYELGREAVHLLLRRLAEPDAPFRTLTLQTRLIVRESCGAKRR
jgi:LacI family transcriptional regulator